MLLKNSQVEKSTDQFYSCIKTWILNKFFPPYQRFEIVMFTQPKNLWLFPVFVKALADLWGTIFYMLMSSNYTQLSRV